MNTSFRRDGSSGALVSNDETAYAQARKRKEARLRQKQEQRSLEEKVEYLTQQVEALTESLLRIAKEQTKTKK